MNKKSLNQQGIITEELGRVNRIGQQIGNYRLIELLGEGGFAKVYLGEHIYLGTQAAIKIVSELLVREREQEFLNEARTLAQLIHPNIVRILDFGIDMGVPFLVMDFAVNGTLRQQYPHGTRVPLTSVVEYVKQIANALQVAHNKKVIHRDIKPANMLIGPNKQVWLSDFGIAVVSHSTQSFVTQAAVGSWPYSAPEQFDGIAFPASDQYALGIVVYEWLCGETPFRGSSLQMYHQHHSVLPPPLREKVPEISLAIERVVLKALEKKPQQRYPSVLQFALALEQASYLQQTPTRLGTSSNDFTQPLTHDVLPVTLERNALEDISHTLKDDNDVLIGWHGFLPGIVKDEENVDVEDQPTIDQPLSPENESVLRTIGTRFNNPLETNAVLPYKQSQKVDADVEESVVASKEIPTVEAPPEQIISYGTHIAERAISQHLTDAEKHYKQKRYSKALQIYTQIIQQDPHNVHAHGGMGNALGKQRKYSEALSAYTKALNIDSKHASLWVAKGAMLCKLMKLDEAIEAYQAALAIHPKDAKTWITYGNTLARIHRYEDALKAYNSTLEIRPDNILVWIAKCNMLCQLERYEEALKCNDDAIKVAPKKALATIWDVRGDILYKLARYDEALEAHHYAMVFAPNNPAFAEKYYRLQDAVKHLKVSNSSAQDNQKASSQKQEQPHNNAEPNSIPQNNTNNARKIKTQHKSAEYSQEAKDGKTQSIEYYDVFLFHKPNSTDTKWVTDLAEHLTNKYKFRVWFSPWDMIPGQSWQKALAHGLDLAICCAICVGQEGPTGWFEQVIELAKNRQAQSPSFRVIPVLLPSAPEGSLERFDFLKLNVGADFRDNDFNVALHILACGIKGIQPGPPPQPQPEDMSDATIHHKPLKSEEMLRHLDHLNKNDLIPDPVKDEYVRITMDRVWLPEWLSNIKEDTDGPKEI